MGLFAKICHVDTKTRKIQYFSSIIRGTDWGSAYRLNKKKLLRCENKKNFALFWINRLFNSDFCRKPQKSRVFTPSSPTKPPPAVNLAALVPHSLPSTTPGPSAPTLVNKLIYPTHISSTRPILLVYMQSPGIKPTSGVYMQFLGTEALLTVYTQLSGTTFGEYIQLSRPRCAAYI